MFGSTTSHEIQPTAHAPRRKVFGIGWANERQRGQELILDIISMTGSGVVSNPRQFPASNSLESSRAHRPKVNKAVADTFRALLTEKGIERLKSDLTRLREAGRLHPDWQPRSPTP